MLHSAIQMQNMLLCARPSEAYHASNKKIHPGLQYDRTMDILKHSENHLDEIQPRWFAVYTRYKREKLVQQRLLDKGIQAYLPLRRVTRRYERKVKAVELPLISCYVFTRIVRKNYVPVLDTPDVLQFVKFSQNLIAIPEREMLLMQRITGEGIEVEVEENSRGLQIGDEVEITGGNLAGIRGILLEKERKNNFLVELKTIGYTLRMSVEPALLGKVKPGRTSVAQAS